MADLESKPAAAAATDSPTTDTHATSIAAAVDEKEQNLNGDASSRDESETMPKSEAAGPPQAAAAHPEEERSKAKIALIMFALCMAVFLAALDVTIITTAVPTIAEYFHSASGYTWIGSGFLLGNAASIPMWGKLSDIWGRKPVILLANIIFFVGSLLAGVAVSITMLIAARVIQGIGAGGLVILANIVIGDLFSPRRRGAYYGIIGGVWAVASSLGPILGGVFTEKVSWRWCFYINLPLDGIAFIIILFLLDVKTPKTPMIDGLKAIDWLGALLIISGTLMFLLGLQFGGNSHPWSSTTVICLLVFGFITVVIFVFVEWKVAKYPVTPLHLFQNRSAVTSFGVAFFHGMVFIGATYYLPLYFQAVRGATPLLSGVYILPTSVALSIASGSTGIFIRKTGKYVPPIVGGMLFMILGIGLFINLDRTSSWAKIIIYQIIAGFGIGPNFQAPLISLQTFVDRRDIGTATATFGFVRQIATSISVVIGGVVFQNQMAKQASTLIAAVGPEQALRIGGSNAGASTKIVDALPNPARTIIQNAYSSSLTPMWIMYTVLAGIGLLFSLGIGKKKLSMEHEETKTGLAGEEDRRRAEQERRQARLNAKAGVLPKDVEKQEAA